MISMSMNNTTYKISETSYSRVLQKMLYHCQNQQIIVTAIKGFNDYTSAVVRNYRKPCMNR